EPDSRALSRRLARRGRGPGRRGGRARSGRAGRGRRAPAAGGLRAVHQAVLRHFTATGSAPEPQALEPAAARYGRTAGQVPPEQAPAVCAAARSVTAGAGKPALAERPLITPGQAGEVAGLFKVLANDSRLRLLHALERAGELCVGDLAGQAGMRPQAVSNQL